MMSAVPAAGIDPAERIVDQTGNGLPDIARTAENLHIGRGELVERPPAHAAGNDMRNVMFQDLVDGAASSASVVSRRMA